MKNKKILALLLALIMIFSLAACGDNNGNSKQTSQETVSGDNNGNSEQTSQETASGDTSKNETKGDAKSFEGKTLKFAGLNGGYGTGAWNAVIQKFQEKTGAKVEATIEKNIDEVVRPQILANNVPDVMYFNIGAPSGFTETLIKENALLDITDVLDQKVLGEEKTVKEKILPGFLDTFMTNPYGDGKTYLAPLFYSPTGLWYNASLFTENGGKYELPKTFDEFFKLGETAKADGVSLFTYPTAGYFDGFTYALINEVGGSELFNKLMNYDVQAWKNESKPVFETIGKIAPYLEPNTVAQANREGFTKNQQAVIDGKALFMPNGNWIVGEMAKTTPEGFKWGFMALPELNAEHGRYAYTFFEQAFVFKNAAEPELAKAFVSYLYSDEAAKLFAAKYPTKDVDADGKEVEVQKGGAIQPIVGAADLVEDDFMKNVYNVYETGVKASLGSFAASPAVEGKSTGELFTAIDSVMNGSKTVDQWHEEFVGVIQAIKDAIDKQ